MKTEVIPEGDTLTVTLIGNILSTNAEKCAESISSAIKKTEGWKVLNLNLKSARMVDSVGINMLIGIIHYVRERGGSVILRIYHHSINRVLEFSRLSELATIILKEKKRPFRYENAS